MNKRSENNMKFAVSKAKMSSSLWPFHTIADNHAQTAKETWNLDYKGQNSIQNIKVKDVFGS